MLNTLRVNYDNVSARTTCPFTESKMRVLELLDQDIELGKDRLTKTDREKVTGSIVVVVTPSFSVVRGGLNNVSDVKLGGIEDAISSARVLQEDQDGGNDLRSSQAEVNPEKEYFEHKTIRKNDASLEGDVVIQAQIDLIVVVDAHTPVLDQSGVPTKVQGTGESGLDVEKQAKEQNGDSEAVLAIGLDGKTHGAFHIDNIRPTHHDKLIPLEDDTKSSDITALKVVAVPLSNDLRHTGGPHDGSISPGEDGIDLDVGTAPLKDVGDTIKHSADSVVNLNPYNSVDNLGSLETQVGIAKVPPLGLRLVVDTKEVSGDNTGAVQSLIPIANGILKQTKLPVVIKVVVHNLNVKNLKVVVQPVVHSGLIELQKSYHMACNTTLIDKISIDSIVDDLAVTGQIDITVNIVTSQLGSVGTVDRRDLVKVPGDVTSNKEAIVDNVQVKIDVRAEQAGLHVKRLSDGLQYPVGVDYLLVLANLIHN